MEQNRRGHEDEKKQWTDNQYPDSWTDKIYSRALDRIIKGKANKSPGEDLHQKSIGNPGAPRMMNLYYRVNESLKFANKVRNMIKASIVFNTRKLKT